MLKENKSFFIFCLKFLRYTFKILCNNDLKKKYTEHDAAKALFKFSLGKL